MTNLQPACVTRSGNNIHLATITRTPHRIDYPKLVLSGAWFGSIGFTEGAFAELLPENDGIKFVLCNAKAAKKGRIYQVRRYRDGLQLCVSGSVLGSAGLEYGDYLLTRYVHGIIRMRKLPGSAVILPDSRVIGPWLAEMGFLPDAVFTIDAQPNLITCQLHENGLQHTAELVKYARANKLHIMQVQSKAYKKRVSRGDGMLYFFDLPQPCLARAGFTPHEMLLALYEHGQIQLQKPDFVGLGF